MDPHYRVSAEAEPLTRLTEQSRYWPCHNRGELMIQGFCEQNGLHTNLIRVTRLLTLTLRRKRLTVVVEGKDWRQLYGRKVEREVQIGQTSSPNEDRGETARKYIGRRQ